MKTTIERFGDDEFKVTNSFGESAYVSHKNIPHPGDTVTFSGPNGPVARQIVEIEIVGRNMGAVVNAVNPTKATFDNAQSFSDGNLVIGIDERKCAINFNNTDGAKNQVLVLNWQDVLNLYAVLTPALRKQKLLFP